MHMLVKITPTNALYLGKLFYKNLYLRQNCMQTCILGDIGSKMLMKFCDDFKKKPKNPLQIDVEISYP